MSIVAGRPQHRQPRPVGRGLERRIARRRHGVEHRQGVGAAARPRQRRGPQPVGDRGPRRVEHAGVDRLERVEHGGVVTVEVGQHGAPDAGEGTGQRMAGGLELEDPGELLAEQVESGQPPGDASEQGDGGQLAVDVTVGPEQVGGGAQGVDGIAGADQGLVQPGGEDGAARARGGGRQVGQPARQARHRRSARSEAGGPQDAGHRLVQAGVGGEGQRVVEAAPGQLVLDGAAMHLAPVLFAEGEARDGGPQRVRHPPTAAVGGHERHAVEGRGQVDRSIERGRGEGVVGAPEVGDDRQDPTAVRAERVEHLLPQEVAGAVARHARGQLGHRRPAARGAETGEVGHPPVGAEARHLVGREPQLVVADVQHLAVGGQARQGDGGVAAPGEHHVPVGRQRLDQPGQPRRPGRPGRQQVDVVEDEADRSRAAPPHRVRHRAGRRCGSVPPVVLGGAGIGRVVDHGGERVAGERHAVGVAGLEPDPHVVAPGRQVVLGDRLGEERRLPQPGTAHDRRDPVLPPTRQRAEEPRTGQRQRPRAGLEPERARQGRRG